MQNLGGGERAVQLTNSIALNLIKTFGDSYDVIDIYSEPSIQAHPRECISACLNRGMHE